MHQGLGTYDSEPQPPSIPQAIRSKSVRHSPARVQVSLPLLIQPGVFIASVGTRNIRIAKHPPPMLLVRSDVSVAGILGPVI
jgi:hypothetical protein